MKKYKVIKLAVNGTYDCGIYEAKSGMSALKKALEKKRPFPGYWDERFIIFVDKVIS